MNANTLTLSNIATEVPHVFHWFYSFKTQWIITFYPNLLDNETHIHFIISNAQTDLYSVLLEKKVLLIRLLYELNFHIVNWSYELIHLQFYNFMSFPIWGCISILRSVAIFNFQLEIKLYYINSIKLIAKLEIFN